MSNYRPSFQASAIVTGAGSGIGRAFALEIAARSGRVVVSDINLAAAEETVRLIGSDQAIAIAADVADLAQMEQLAEQAEAWLGAPVDLMVNNAGVGVGGALIGDQPYTDWQWVMGINLWGVVHGCHIFAPKMRMQGRGGIINVCSAAAFGAAPKMGAYNVTKAAALALSETLSAECQGTGVHVTALCPTWVKTNIAHNGRIQGAANPLAHRFIDKGMDPARVVRETLNALDANRLYVMPQMDAKIAWRLKRFFPDSYRRTTTFLTRTGERFLGKS